MKKENEEKRIHIYPDKLKTLIRQNVPGLNQGKLAVRCGEYDTYFTNCYKLKTIKESVAAKLEEDYGIMREKYEAPARKPERKKAVKNEGKDKYGLFHNVLLTKDEYKKLVEEYGQEVTDKAVEHLDGYIAEKGEDKSDNHYCTIRRWVVGAVTENKSDAKLDYKPIYQYIDFRFNELKETISKSIGSVVSGYVDEKIKALEKDMYELLDAQERKTDALAIKEDRDFAESKKMITSVQVEIQQIKMISSEGRVA